MRIGQITLAEAAAGTWIVLWKGILWASSMLLACLAFGVEWNWRIFAVCTVSSFFDWMIYGPPSRLNSSGDRGGK